MLDSVMIGVDPHKHSATIEVVDGRERVLHQGRYGTDPTGRCWPRRGDTRTAGGR